MTNLELRRVAMRQSAVDLSCQPEDFCAANPVVVHSRPLTGARRYLTLPFFCQLVTYGGNVVASVAPCMESFILQYLRSRRPEQCFEPPAIHELTAEAAKHGKVVGVMTEYFLPDVARLHPLPCPYEIRVLHPEDFIPLYIPQWSNALCEKRRHLDVLGAGAYDGNTLVGLAGCSADCDDMWQIGIDVLPQYRRQGIATALTSRLACEILARGKVPFYCAAWANIPSVRNAIASGFLPSWAELTVCAPQG